MSNETERLSFTNPNIAAFLALHAIPIKSQRVNDLIIFTVSENYRTEATARIAEFHQNALVPIIDFVAALQEVKKSLYRRGAR